MTTLSSTLALAPEIERWASDFADWKAFDDSVRPVESAFARQVLRAYLGALDALRGALESPDDLEAALAAARAVLEPWLREAANLVLPLALERGWRRGVAQVEAALRARKALLDLPFDLTWPAISAYLFNRPHAYSPPIADSTIDQLRTILREGFDAGLGIDNIRLDIMGEELPGVSKARAERIARTEILSAANLGNFESYRASGVVQKKRWLCVTGDTRVSGHRVSHVSRRWYEGLFVTLRTANGRRVCVTAEHPVLTRRGWVRADAVHEGDDLFRYESGVEALRRIPPDVDHVPPKIGEVFDSLSQSGADHWAVGGIVDLDGERRDRDVDVVLVDGQLRRRLEPLGAERIEQFMLEGSDIRQRGLLDDRTTFKRALTYRDSSPRIASLLGLPLSRCGISFRAHTPGVTLGARNHSCHAQAFTNARAGTRVAPREHHDRRAVEVCLRDFGGASVQIPPANSRWCGQHGRDLCHSLLWGLLGDLGPLALREASQWDAKVTEPIDDTSRRTSVSLGDSFRRISRQVFLREDRCVSAEKIRRACHVFDYSTAVGWMVANGLVISNSTQDGRVRDSHRSWEWPEERRIVPLDEPFVLLPNSPNGDISELMFPGDASMGAALDQIINCRCSLAPVVEGLYGI